MKLCKYKNLFGEPKTGLHNYRIFDFAIFDILTTILGSVIIHQIIIVQILKKSDTIKLWMVIVFMFILGILLHRLFCVRTTVDKLLFNE
jgi:hypothetical protein